MELKNIDLNLLLVFHQLLAERRVSKVAENRGMTQPGVSNALKRLRVALGDELFVRTARGMEPTPYAAQLGEPIGYALSTIFDTLNEGVRFDPATSDRKFKIGMTDIGEVYFLPALMAALREQAPDVSISTVRNTAVNLQDEMEAGHIDLAIGLLPQLKSGYFQRQLFRQRYVCMFRQGHELDKSSDKASITVEEFERAEHVVVVSGGTGHAIVDQTIERLGIHRKIGLTVPHFVAVGHILSASSMIATVPERYAMACVKPFGLRYATHPLSLPEININIFWHARFNKEPANQWLRRLIFERFADGGSGLSPEPQNVADAGRNRSCARPIWREVKKSERVLLPLWLDGDPFQVGELVDHGAAIKLAVTAVLGSAVGRLCFILYRGAVHVHRARIDAQRYRQCPLYVAPEHGR